jgi:hypothetical protein
MVYVFSYFVILSWSKWLSSVDYYGTSVPNRAEEARMLQIERGTKNTSKYTLYRNFLYSSIYRYLSNIEILCNKAGNVYTTLTLRRVSVNYCCRGKAIIITYYECAFVAFYPARNAHVPYCHLWSLRLYNIFQHYLINGTNSEKRYWT